MHPLSQQYPSPSIAEWIDGGDTLEIGNDYHTDSTTRLIDQGGLVRESYNQEKSIDELLQLCEKFLETYEY